MWKKYVSSLSKKFDFSNPTDNFEVEKTENKLKLVFPKELSELLSETNGLHDSSSYSDIVWSIENIQRTNSEFRENRDFRELYMPFDSLLFFGDSGNGDQFAFRILANKIRTSDIYVWNHEDDSRVWIAPSLKIFLEWWLTGKIKI